MAIRKGAVKTKFLGGTAISAPMSPAPIPMPIRGAVYDDWIIQDELTIIGCEVSVAVEASSESFALAEHILALVELSRAGAMERDGAIAMVSLEARWATTVVSSGLDYQKQIVLSLPSGRGIDVDPGEVLNLLWYGHAESAQQPRLTASAIVYYIER